jgi:hypothetical protein
MNHKRLLLLTVFAVAAGLIATAIYAAAVSAGDVPRMSKEELKGQLGNPEVVILDMRRGGDWKNSTHKIKGAVREDDNPYMPWAEKYAKDKTLVLYCA